MALKSIQVRLTEEQLKMIDEKIEAGEYPNRSEAIRDYVRRAESFELFQQLLDILGSKGFTQEELDETRQQLWDSKYKQRLVENGK